MSQESNFSVEDEGAYLAQDINFPSDLLSTSGSFSLEPSNDNEKI